MHKHSANVPGRSLALSPDVRACVVDGQVILLHLRLNRYVGICGSGSALLASCLTRDGANAQEQAWNQLATASDGLGQRLVDSGLLVQLEHQAIKCRAADASEEATASLDLGDLCTRQPLGTRNLVDFLSSATKTAWWLRSRSLHAIAKTIADRRARAGLGSDDPVRVRRCAASYERLRPLLLTARDKCLFDSLALTNFLATEQQFPRWVIGVKANPFGAHSWVQSGATVLNDQHEYVRRFKPILVV